MSELHLPIERLAELADTVPTPFEREHLQGCARCARELEAYRGVVSLARDERRRIAPPLTNWTALRGALDAEGLVARPGRRMRPAQRWMWRAASAVVLAGGGAVAGRLSAGIPLGGFGVAASNVPEVGESVAMAVGDGTSFRSSDEALAQLERAQRAYEDAAAYLAAHDTTSGDRAPDQYRTRLAALDMASETFEQALTDAPVDPILNQYFMATMNAREATIRRLGTAMPASVRVGRF